MNVTGVQKINPKGTQPRATSLAIVLERQEKSGYRHVFRAPDDTDTYAPIVYVHETAWADMGQPDEITVTIEPGNALQRRYEEWTPLDRAPVVGEVVKFVAPKGRYGVEGRITSMVEHPEAHTSFRLEESLAIYAWAPDNAKYWSVKTDTIGGK